MQKTEIETLTEKLSKAKISILIADDSESNQTLMALYFKPTACAIDFAKDGLEAVKHFTKNTYDLILMDILMPNMDGFQATRTIRALEREQNRSPIPIVAVTANAFDEDKRQSIEAGCTDFLAKPIRKLDILQCVASAMGME